MKHAVCISTIALVAVVQFATAADGVPETTVNVTPVFDFRSVAPAATFDPGRPERDPWRVGGKMEGFLGTWTGQQMLRDSAVWDDPLWKRLFSSDESWRYNLPGPIHLFGQLGASWEEAEQADTQLRCRTGVAWQVPVPAGELLVRSGPSLTCTDPLRADHMREKSELLVELQGKLPLLFGVGLEYQSTAAPAISALDHDWVTQDVRLAFPIGTSGKLRFGAKRHWENLVEPRPAPDAMQLYLGIELKH